MKIWLLCLILSVGVGMLTPLIKDVFGEILGKIYGVTLIPFLWMFLSAAFVSEFRENLLPFIKRFSLIAILIAVSIYVLKFDLKAEYNVFFTLTLFVGLLGVSYSLYQLNIKRDISYGIYISHDNRKRLYIVGVGTFKVLFAGSLLSVYFNCLHIDHYDRRMGASKEICVK